MKNEIYLFRKKVRRNITDVCAEYLKPILNIMEQISSDFDDEKANTRCTKLSRLNPRVDGSHNVLLLKIFRTILESSV